MPKPVRTTDRRLLPNKTLIPHKGGVPLPQPPSPPKPPGNKPATTGTER